MVHINVGYFTISVAVLYNKYCEKIEKMAWANGISIFICLMSSVMMCAVPTEDVVNLASRRLSVSPSCASSNSHRNYSFRRGSVWSVRSAVSAEG